MTNKAEQFIKKLNSVTEKMAEVYEKRPVLYYYVPPCPACGSRITGRYVRRPSSKWDMEYVYEDSLKHGELVKMAERVPIANAYCEECGNEWPQHLGLKILPAWQVEEEKKIRNTDAAYWNAKKDARKKPFWNRFTGFFS